MFAAAAKNQASSISKTHSCGTPAWEFWDPQNLGEFHGDLLDLLGIYIYIYSQKDEMICNFYPRKCWI
jgi:hypothetical protein